METGSEGLGLWAIATSSDSPSPSILPTTSPNILYVPGNDIILVNCHVASQKWDLVSPDFLSNVDLGGNTLNVEIRGGYWAEMEAAKSDPRSDLRAMKVELHQLVLFDLRVTRNILVADFQQENCRHDPCICASKPRFPEAQASKPLIPM
jgi:hypothetical protein